MMDFRAIFCCLCLAATFAALAPEQASAQTGGEPVREKVYQLSGLVLDRSTGDPLPYVRLTIPTRRRYALANYDGFYSIPVVDGDTIYLSEIGYKPEKFDFGAYLDQYKGDKDTTYIYAIIYMRQDTLTTPEITIYPYKNAQDVKMAILNMDRNAFKVPAEQAYANVDPQLMSYFMSNLPADDEERIAIARQRLLAIRSEQNTRPSVTLVDPVAIYRLIDYIGTKNKQKRENILQYAPE